MICGFPYVCCALVFGYTVFNMNSVKCLQNIFYSIDKYYKNRLIPYFDFLSFFKYNVGSNILMFFVVHIYAALRKSKLPVRTEFILF